MKLQAELGLPAQSDPGLQAGLGGPSLYNVPRVAVEPALPGQAKGNLGEGGKLLAASPHTPETVDSSKHALAASDEGVRRALSLRSESLQDRQFDGPTPVSPTLSARTPPPETVDTGPGAEVADLVSATQLADTAETAEPANVQVPPTQQTQKPPSPEKVFQTKCAEPKGGDGTDGTGSAMSSPNKEAASSARPAPPNQSSLTQNKVREHSPKASVGSRARVPKMKALPQKSDKYSDGSYWKMLAARLQLLKTPRIHRHFVQKSKKTGQPPASAAALEIFRSPGGSTLHYSLAWCPPAKARKSRKCWLKLGVT